MFAGPALTSLPEFNRGIFHVIFMYVSLFHCTALVSLTSRITATPIMVLLATLTGQGEVPKEKWRSHS